MGNIIWFNNYTNSSPFVPPLNKILWNQKLEMKTEEGKESSINIKGLEQLHLLLRFVRIHHWQSAMYASH